MKRVTLAEASAGLTSLVEEVISRREPIELERENRVVAVLSPPALSASFSVMDLEALLRALPSLGEDHASFARDVESARSGVHLDVDAWD